MLTFKLDKYIHICHDIKNVQIHKKPESEVALMLTVTLLSVFVFAFVFSLVKWWRSRVKRLKLLALYSKATQEQNEYLARYMGRLDGRQEMLVWIIAETIDVHANHESGLPDGIREWRKEYFKQPACGEIICDATCEWVRQHPKEAVAWYCEFVSELPPLIKTYHF